MEKHRGKHFAPFTKVKEDVEIMEKHRGNHFAPFPKGTPIQLRMTSTQDLKLNVSTSNVNMIFCAEETYKQISIFLFYASFCLMMLSDGFVYFSYHFVYN